MAGKWTTGAPVIAGGEGSLIITEDGKQIELASVSSVEVNVEHDKADIQPVGHRLTLHKVTGSSGSGSMTLYYMSSRFGHHMEAYKDTGVSPYFDMIVTNDDPASPAKRQRVLLKGVNLDSDVLSTLDGSHTELTVDCDFTFEDFQILESFCQNVDAVSIEDYNTTASDELPVVGHLLLCPEALTAGYKINIKGSPSIPSGASRMYKLTSPSAKPIISSRTVIAKTDWTTFPENSEITSAKRGQGITVVDVKTDGTVVNYGTTDLTTVTSPAAAAVTESIDKKMASTESKNK